MTNITSIGGSALWMAVAAVLMLATFEPVSPGGGHVEGGDAKLAGKTADAPAPA